MKKQIEKQLLRDLKDRDIARMVLKPNEEYSNAEIASFLASSDLDLDMLTIMLEKSDVKFDRTLILLAWWLNEVQYGRGNDYVSDSVSEDDVLHSVHLNITGVTEYIGLRKKQGAIIIPEELEHTIFSREFEKFLKRHNYPDAYYSLHAANIQVSQRNYARIRTQILNNKTGGIALEDREIMYCK